MPVRFSSRVGAWRRRVLRAALLLAAASAIASCETSGSERSGVRTGPPRLPPPPPVTGQPALEAGFTLLPTAFSDLPDWRADRQGEALLAFVRSCDKIENRAPSAPMGGGGLFGSVGQWRRACAAARRTPGYDAQARTFFEQWFLPYRVMSAGSDEGTFTGYYEPMLNGSWRRTATHATPLHRPPDSRSRTPTRAQIAAGALAGRGLEILWVDDPIAAFFLQIQGSGRVRMTSGEIVRLGYAGQNGQPYFPIGRELIRRGEIAPEAMSMQAIRAWLQSHPDQATSLMNMNASYVFFRILEGDGPIGAQGVALTPGRSLAVDPAFVPYGVPAWLDTTDPVHGYAPMRRLLVAQDTGGAIKGPIRGDVFWGLGAEAELRAGLMKQPGRYYLLLPREAAAVS